MEFMRTLPDRFFDLAIVDPPYGIGEDGCRNATRNHEGKATHYRPYTGNDSEAPPREYFIELSVGCEPLYQPFTRPVGYLLLDRVGQT